MNLLENQSEMSMKLIVIVVVALAATCAAAASEESALRRVPKSAPGSERFASFGKRSLTESSQANPQAAASEQKPASSGAQISSSSKSEVELLSSAPSTWQVMSALEAPASQSAPGDLSASSSDDASSSFSQGDFLRSPSAGTKGGFAPPTDTFSRLRQETLSKTRQQQQQQSFFQPPKQRAPPSKTSNFQAAKTNWYQPKPAPIVQERFEQQQNEQYVEQQQVESAPPGQAEPFAFDFNTQDTSGNGQYRKETSDNNGVVRGAYGFRDASGIYRHVEYVADQNGFRANIKSNEPGVEAGPKSQPASIRLDGGGPAPEQSQRFTSSNNDNADWSATSSSDEHANLALAPPNFESSHKSERIRAGRQATV